jgi:nicotinamidase-related amidase
MADGSRNLGGVANLGRLSPGGVIFCLCDIQDRFRDVIDIMPQVISVAKGMIKTAETFSIPLVITEQYPKALGNTVPELKELSEKKEGKEWEAKIIEKTRFSMCTNEFLAHVESIASRKAVVIFGVEAHVCVQQTVLDLLARDYSVHVIVDGVSSQRPLDREVAIERMRQSGAFITTAESVMFELTRSKDSAEFKAMSQIAKSHGEGLKELKSSI